MSRIRRVVDFVAAVYDVLNGWYLSTRESYHFGVRGPTRGKTLRRWESRSECAANVHLTTVGCSHGLMGLGRICLMWWRGRRQLPRDDEGKVACLQSWETVREHSGTFAGWLLNNLAWKAWALEGLSEDRQWLVRIAGMKKTWRPGRHLAILHRSLMIEWAYSRLAFCGGLFRNRASCLAAVVVRRTKVSTEVVLMPSCGTAFSASMSSREDGVASVGRAFLKAGGCLGR